MTVIFFTRLFYPHIGGVETHVLKISRELLKKGHVVMVITELHSTELPRVENYQGIVIYRIPVLSEKNKKFEIWKWLWDHKKLLRKADIIHAHDVGFWFLPFKFLYPKKKFFITFHGYETRFPPQKKAIVLRRITEFMSNGSICVGEYIKKWYGAKSSIVVYGGIDKIHDSIPVPRTRGFKIQDYNSNLKILFIGRIEEDNGVKVYRKALELLKKKKIPFTFTAVGDGSLKKEFEKYGDILGFVPDPYIYIKNSSIIFSSSYLSILNALNYNKKVIAVYTNQLKKDYLIQSSLNPFIFITEKAEEVVAEVMKKSKREYNKELEKWLSQNTWQSLAEKYISLWKH